MDSWKLRDRHMAATLQELLRFLDRSHTGARVVVWAHNSHLGDARATEMGERGELNVGQLAREQYGHRSSRFWQCCRISGRRRVRGREELLDLACAPDVASPMRRLPCINLLAGIESGRFLTLTRPEGTITQGVGL
jgi:hypothetical protein